MDNVFRELLVWIKKQPHWEQVAFSQILEGKEFDSVDYDNLVHLVLLENELVKGKLDKSKLTFLSNWKSNKAKAETSKLIRIYDIKNVNALVEGEKITFSKNLTTLFGKNATGKSGYARLLAFGGSTRGRSELLPDITKEITSTPTARATILLSNDSEKDIRIDSSKELELRGCWVFNSESVKAHLSSNTVDSFTPSILYLLTELASVVDIVSEKLNKEIEIKKPQVPFSNYFNEESKVTKWLETINEKTDLNKVRKITFFGGKEKKRLEGVSILITELKLADKNKLKLDLKQLEETFLQFNDQLSMISQLLSPDKIANVNKLI